MGVHFGWVNQLVMFGLALATLALSAWGYVMWWQRRPRSGGKVGPAPTLASVRQVPFWVWVLLLSGTLAVGFFLPVLGASLLVFVVADLAVQAIRWLMLRSRL
ncbi:hypothetical protein [Rothia nasimurium]|uniref:hypothetical protein n=1 Tax=Rothia nasimurium TaxID=85336 RepID=UPI00214C46B3|nr:hypothetical protein [Rothia nasimurium]